MSKYVDITGEKFGRLLVIKRNGWNNHNQITWDCKCECGNWVPNVPKQSLMTGNTRSCGCLSRELIQSRNASHGMAGTRIYRIFNNMKTRCNNSKVPNFYLYGGRGIKCLWKSFEEFYRDMGDEYNRLEGSGKKISIERIDVNGNYCKENCRWATDEEQANNTRRNHYLTFNGEKKTITQWARQTGSTQERIRARLKRGYTEEQALYYKKHQNRI